MQHRGLIMSFVVAFPVALAVGHAASGCVFRSADDCELTLGFGCDPSATSSGTTSSGGGTGGGAGGNTSSSTSSSSGGTGGTATCVDPSLCPDPDPGPCASFATKLCEKGQCAIKYTAADLPSAFGSCTRRSCDAEGKLTEGVDDTNLYDDGNPCTQETCTGGVPDQTQLTNMACMVDGSTGVCLADPYNPSLVTCAECMPPGTSTCIGGAICVQGKCVPAHCKNGTKDLGETDVDCGGSTSGCLKCAGGGVCTNYLDCASQVCTMGKCAAPTCSDTHQNQDETDIDCGGKTCGQPCTDGLKCILSSDCVSKVCKGNVCQPPSCADGVQNGDEEGLDCGGVNSMCPACVP